MLFALQLHCTWEAYTMLPLQFNDITFSIEYNIYTAASHDCYFLAVTEVVSLPFSATIVCSPQ